MVGHRNFEPKEPCATTRNIGITGKIKEQLHGKCKNAGPRSKRTGISVDIIKKFAGMIPVLGVCLGHQCIGFAYGGKIIQAKRLMHGKTSLIKHDGKEIFKGVDNPFEATRYHSLVVDPRTLPSCLTVTARSKDKDKEIMAIRHKEYPLWGVQFHPESILTGMGKNILKNFLNQK